MASSSWYGFRFSSRSSPLCLAALVAFAATGCGKSATREGFAEAYGTITLDGKPLANAEVIFETEKGSSYGRTDDNGEYCAQYSRTLSGAGIGKARVKISTKVIFPDENLEELDYNTKTGEHTKVELVPPKYNTNSELTVEIKQDGAPYDFALVTTP